MTPMVTPPPTQTLTHLIHREAEFPVDEMSVLLVERLASDDGRWYPR